MPALTINTNVPASRVPADFKAQMTDVLAKTLGKPKAYIAVHVNAGQDISFGGTDEPAALCDLVSIGALSRDSNKKHSEAIMKLLEHLKVDASRIYISFHNMDKSNIGHMSTTFDDLM